MPVGIGRQGNGAPTRDSSGMGMRPICYPQNIYLDLLINDQLTDFALAKQNHQGAGKRQRWTEGDGGLGANVAAAQAHQSNDDEPEEGSDEDNHRQRHPTVPGANSCK